MCKSLTFDIALLSSSDKGKRKLFSILNTWSEEARKASIESRKEHEQDDPIYGSQAPVDLMRKIAAYKRPQNRDRKVIGDEHKGLLKPQLAYLQTRVSAKTGPEWQLLDADHKKSQYIMEHNAHVDTYSGRELGPVHAWKLIHFHPDGSHTIVKEYSRETTSPTENLLDRTDSTRRKRLRDRMKAAKETVEDAQARREKLHKQAEKRRKELEEVQKKEESKKKRKKKVNNEESKEIESEEIENSWSETSRVAALAAKRAKLIASKSITGSPEELGFLHAIHSEPHNLIHKHIYSDWLRDQGYDTEAEQVKYPQSHREAKVARKIHEKEIGEHLESLPPGDHTLYGHSFTKRQNGTYARAGMNTTHRTLSRELGYHKAYTEGWSQHLYPGPRAEE